METKLVNKKAIEKLSKALLEEKIIAFPTETVYGLAVIYDSKKAIEKLKEVKQRPKDKPFTLMVPSTQYFKAFAQLTNRDKEIINHFTPGALTLILNRKEEIPSYITNGYPTIGIRYPDDPFVLELINSVNKPLLVPSANISNEPPAINHQEVLESFNGLIDYVVEGECLSKQSSTIIDLTDSKDIRIIRQGEITLDQIRRKIK